MIWALLVYMWLMVMVMGYLVAHGKPYPRSGLDLFWRLALTPVLVPLILISALVKGRR